VLTYPVQSLHVSKLAPESWSVKREWRFLERRLRRLHRLKTCATNKWRLPVDANTCLYYHPPAMSENRFVHLHLHSVFSFLDYHKTVSSC